MRRWMLAMLGVVAMGAGAALADDELLQNLLDSAKTAETAPAAVPDRLPAATTAAADPLGTVKPRAPAGAVLGTVTLNTGKTYEGRVWTTLETPIRVWVEEVKMYRDVDLDSIRRVDVKVLQETMEPDWRWLKEGSDQKVYSGKKYPLVDLAYRFTLVNGQVIEGTAVAPIYVADGEKMRTLALYKKYKGELDQTLADVAYIKAIKLDADTARAEAAAERTTRLPLIEGGY